MVWPPRFTSPCTALPLSSVTTPPLSKPKTFTRKSWAAGMSSYTSTGMIRSCVFGMRRTLRNPRFVVLYEVDRIGWVELVDAELARAGSGHGPELPVEVRLVVVTGLQGH